MNDVLHNTGGHDALRHPRRQIVASGLTLGSGAPGGSFFPAVFLGAMLGGWFGHVGQHLLPSLIAAPPAYAAVGMAAVVAGATNAPLTAIDMLWSSPAATTSSCP